MIIRRKELKDCESWVDIHTRSWIHCLKGVVSSKIINIILESKDLRIKKDLEEFYSNNWNYVLENDNRVIGIMILKESNRIGFEGYGELDTLYLDPDEIGKGYGKFLFLKAYEEFQKRGYSKFVVGCLDGNSANLFYKHMGGKFIRQDSWDFLGEHYMENIYLCKIH